MATYFRNKDFQIESLKENLFAAELCLKFDKSKEEWSGGSKVGCLGIPAAILLCSLIDTIGSVFRNTEMEVFIDGKYKKIEKAYEHFCILNHEKFFKCNLTLVTINDFYETYRSKLTHNNSLPGNNFLDIGNFTDDIFELNAEYKINKINLLSLYNITKSAVHTLIYYLEYGTFSPDHKLTNELYQIAKPYNSDLNISASASGEIFSENFNV